MGRKGRTAQDINALLTHRPIKLVESSYVNAKTKALFVDEIYGEWWALPSRIINKPESRHPDHAIQQRTLPPEIVAQRIREGFKNIPGRDYVTFSKEEYKNTGTSITFFDSLYGEWQCTPNSVMFGTDHPLRRATDSRALEKDLQQTRPYLSIKHETYKNMNEKCVFVDADYGEFEAQPIFVKGLNTRRPSDHPERARLEKMRMSPAVLNKRIQNGYREIPPRPWLCMDESTFDGVMKNAKFIDDEYGIFYGTPNNVVNHGTNHPHRFRKHLLTVNDLIQMLPPELILIKKTYQGSLYKKATFLDRQYGAYRAQPYDIIIKGQRHPLRRNQESVIPAEVIQNRITLGWGKIGPRPWLKLVKASYVNSTEKVMFIDDKYGEFYSSPNAVLSGVQHPARSLQHTKPERIMEELLGLKKFNQVVSDVGVRPDFKLNCKTYLEVDGLFWHSELKIDDRWHHFKRRELFEKAGLRLFQIRQHEIYERSEIVKSILLHSLGQSKRIFARKTKLQKVTWERAEAFFDSNHLMGAARCITYGLFWNDILVCTLGYKVIKNELHIVRFCSKLGYHVIGGFTKLLSNILKIVSVKSVVNFVDLRYGQGSYLVKLGFVHVGTTLGWQWTNGTKVFNRLHCRANMDVRRLSEREHAKEMKLYKIYDAGQAKFIKTGV